MAPSPFGSGDTRQQRAGSHAGKEPAALAPSAGCSRANAGSQGTGQVRGILAVSNPYSRQSPQADGSRSLPGLRGRGTGQSPASELPGASSPLAPSPSHLSLARALPNTLHTAPAAPGCPTSATDFIV